MHERLSLSGLCFPTLGLDDALATIAELGAHHTSLSARALRDTGWDAAVASVERSGVAVTALIEGPFDLADRSSWAATRTRIVETLDVAAALGGRAVYMVAGRPISADWAVTATAFTDAVGPLVEHARGIGLHLCIEPANTLYADVTFVHSLAAAAHVMAMSDVGVCLDVFHVWTEPRLREQILELGPRTGLVQISDFVPGDRSLPCRAVPGDGAVPLAAIVGWILESGYDGLIDIELSGPRIDAEGHVAAARRAVDALTEIVTALT